MRLLAASAAWVAGVAMALQWDVSTAALGLLLVAPAVLGVLFWRRGWNLLLPLALASMLLGMGRVELAGPPLMGLQPWIGEKGLKVEGVVAEDPEARGTALRFRFRVQRVKPGDDWLDTPGDILRRHTSVTGIAWSFKGSWMMRRFSRSSTTGSTWRGRG